MDYQNITNKKPTNHNVKENRSKQKVHVIVTETNQILIEVKSQTSKLNIIKR